MDSKLNSRIWAGMLSIYLIWGSTYLAIRYAVQTIPPFLMAGFRFLVAGIIILTWRRLAHDVFPPRKEIRSAAIVGLFLLLGGNGLVVWAEQRVVSSVTALIIGSVPLFVVVLELFWPGRPRPNWKVLVGVIGGFLGIAVLIRPSQLSTSATQIDPLGAVALLFASFFWAIGSIYASQAEMPGSPLMGTAVEMLAGAGGTHSYWHAGGRVGKIRRGGYFKRIGPGFRILDRIRLADRVCFVQLAAESRTYCPGLDLCLCKSDGSRISGLPDCR